MEHVIALYHWISAVLAVIFYGYPARNLTVIAVTGTSGKTTTAHLVYSFLKAAGYRVSLFSSVSVIIGEKEYETSLHVTTPTPFSLQKFLKMAVKEDCKFAVIEASSHGIAQYRMLGTNVRIGILTNIAHEHLDWHKTFAAYARSKLSLIAKSKIAIVNKDDQSYGMLNSYKPLSARIITYSLKNKADFHAPNLPLESNLPGDYNKENILAAGATAIILGVDKRIISLTLKTFRGIIGRFEEIKNKRGFRIIIDFAHKPNAFEAFLKTLKKMAKGKIIIMFGSAGERDREKRAMMGKIAGKYANISVLTAEDPRREDVNNITEEIAKGCLKAGAIEGIREGNQHYFVRILDRAKAINFVINKVAQKGDIVAFLGKSHEKSMCYGTTEYPWSEHEEIYKALAKK